MNSWQRRLLDAATVLGTTYLVVVLDHRAELVPGPSLWPLVPVSLLLAWFSARSRRPSLTLSVPFEFAVAYFGSAASALAVQTACLVLRYLAGEERVRSALTSEATKVPIAFLSVQVPSLLLTNYPTWVTQALAGMLFVIIKEVDVAASSERVRHDSATLAMLIAAYSSASVLVIVLYPKLHLWGLALSFLVAWMIKYSGDLVLQTKEVYQATLEATVAAIEAGTPDAAGHGVRVSRVARKIAESAGFRWRERDTIAKAALLHELGFPVQGMDVGEGGATLERVSFLSETVPVLRALQSSAPDVPLKLRRMAYVVHRAARVDVKLNGGPCNCYAFVEQELDEESRQRINHSVDALVTFAESR